MPGLLRLSKLKMNDSQILTNIFQTLSKFNLPLLFLINGPVQCEFTLNKLQVHGLLGVQMRERPKLSNI